MEIRSLAIATHCLDDLYDFYAAVLGLPVGESSRQGQPSFTITLEGTRFTFSEAAQGQPYYHFAFNIAENKIEEALKWIKAKGIEPIEWNGIVIHDFKNWNAHSFYFFDPAGNIVEFIARHDLKQTQRNTPFDVSHIFSVSEIGWVVDNVLDARRAMQEEIGLPLYYTEGDGRRFAAMGDPCGLFILVEKGRDWFPTQCPARVFPMKVAISMPVGTVASVWTCFPSENYPYALEVL